MPVPHSALSATGSVRPDDSGTAIRGWEMLPRSPLRNVDEAALFSIARGLSAATANPFGSRTLVCVPWSSTTP